MVIIVTGIISVGLASYLKLAVNQQRSVARSAAWNETIPVLEAGIEEALAQISSGTDAASMINNGWSISGTNYVRERTLDGNRYVARISVGVPPVIISSGFVNVPGTTSTVVTRTVQVGTRSSSLFMKGMVAKGQIDLRGNNIRTDSFDSSSTSYSTGGIYDSSKAKSNGDVATNSGLVNSLSVGNANILGKVSTGPGGSVRIGPKGAVGDAAWHAGGNSGIQPGYSSDDMNVSFPDVVAPYTVGLPPVGGTLGGTNYAYILTTGDYSVSSLSLSGSSNNKILVTGDARLYVSGNISLSGQSGIIIDSTGSLKLYAAGASTSIGGNGVANGSGLAQDFQYFGLPSNMSLSFNGNAAYNGTIYAPHADLSLGGGGKNNYDFVGASISKSVSMNGHFNFHYDEALANMSAGGKYVITAWNEL
jgi:hypothetical protein